MAVLGTGEWRAMLDAASGTALLSTRLSLRGSRPASISSDTPAGSSGVRLGGPGTGGGPWLDRVAVELSASVDRERGEITLILRQTLARVRTASTDDGPTHTVFRSVVSTSTTAADGQPTFIPLGNTGDGRVIILACRASTERSAKRLTSSGVRLQM